MASEVVLSKCLHFNKRGELNDERNTSKIETVDELQSSRVRYNADPEQMRVETVLVIEVGGGGVGSGGLYKCPLFQLKMLRYNYNLSALTSVAPTV